MEQKKRLHLDRGAAPVSERVVLVIYVGGTLGMEDSGAGLAPSKKGLFLANTMRSMQELSTTGGIAPRFDVIEFHKKVDSSLMGPSHWLQIAHVVQKYYTEYEGFVIAHGTDTMHITAAALSFLLENLAKPVILTGAMLPLGEAYNDARRNLVLALWWASSVEICEVCIFSNELLLRGNRSVKVRHTLSAFESPNYKPLVDVGAQDELLSLRRDLVRPQPRGEFYVSSTMKGNVLTVLCHPDFAADELLAVAVEMDAVIFEILGVGAPDGPVAKMLQKFANGLQSQGRPKLLCVTTQDLNGFLSSGLKRMLAQILPGVVFLGDMTTDCARVKAMYVLGLGVPLSKAQELMVTDLRGEVSAGSGVGILSRHPQEALFLGSHL